MWTNTSSRPSARSRFPRPGVDPAILTLASLLFLMACATGAPSGPSEGIGGSGNEAEDKPSCATQALAPGWPDTSRDNEALLAPFLSCASPADFLALQGRVDMPRLVARLDAWSAVRLGALGPVREEAAHLLNRQRTTFLLQALERYGPVYTEVLAHFVLDSSYDDDLREVLFLLAQDKRLQEVLEQLPSLGPALEARGLKPSAHAERDFQWSDVGRGLGRAAEDALATSPVVNGARSTLGELDALRAQLPPPYRQAIDAATHAQLERQWSAGNVALGVADHMTFGVPLGFYGLVVSTGEGAQSLARGRYEQAVRQLAPAALLVALHTGGRSMAWLSEVRGGSGLGERVRTGLDVLETRIGNLQELVRQLREQMGEEGLSRMASYIRASRETGRWVAEGGVDAALALHETRGNVAQAQAMLSRAHREATGAPKGKGGTTLNQGGGLERLGTLTTWVDEQTGLTQEVVQAKLTEAELETTSPRLSKDVAVLERQRPSVTAPPLDARGNPRWSDYVAYYERRLGELREGKATKGPLRWDAYERLWGWFTRGLAFERDMVKLLKADAELPRVQRRFLGDFDKPRVEAYVGVKKPSTGLRFADVLVIEEGASPGTPRIETFSFKSRDFSGLKIDIIQAQMIEDAHEALKKYGETLDIRRDTIHSLLHQGHEVKVQRTRLIYDGNAALMPKTKGLPRVVNAAMVKVPKVEVLFQ